MRIALVSEGTFPYSMGGVSVWCDQLIRGLPDCRWEMVALTVDGSERQRWDSPPNLDRIRSIPLWLPRRRAAWGGGPGADFAPVFTEFVTALLTCVGLDETAAAANRDRFLGALRGLYEYAAAGGDLADALLSESALTIVVDLWRGIRVEAPDALNLGDACQAMGMLGQMLRALTAEPVRADVVHLSMNGLPALVGLAAKWRHGTPLVLSEHGIYLRERYIAALATSTRYPVRVLILGFFRWLAGAAYLTTDMLTPHSAYNRRWQLANGADPARMWTMYNGIAPDEFPPARQEPAQPTISFMGRIDPLKDLMTLIRAFSLVRAKIPDARLRMFGGTPAGNEPYRDGCLRLIEELGLTGAAVLEGPVDHPAHAYHAASIVALTSISEGFPYTIVEAMACGRTIVCTNVGGVAEAVGDTGLVVPPRDEVAIAEACVALLTDDARRHALGDRARRRVLARFTLRQSLDAYLGVYQHVTTGRGEPIGVAPRTPATVVPARVPMVDARVLTGATVGSRT